MSARQAVAVCAIWLAVAAIGVTVAITHQDLGVVGFIVFFAVFATCAVAWDR